MTAERSIYVRLRANASEFKKVFTDGVKTLKDVEAAAKQTEVAFDRAKSNMAAATKRVEAAQKSLERAQKSTTKTAAQKEAADRRLKSALDAQKKANTDLATAEAAHKKSLEDVSRAQKAAETTTGSLAQSLRENEQAWRATGGALAAAGAATTALTVSVVKTGVAYNTLQQTSRAALTTMLGSAEAANAQMDRLDDFARTSPFAKQVFINAQRQMLGFGVASEKVIPYLDSIQNAVAAMGGSNDDIAGIAESISKVQSSGKITAVTLMELGRRGIDAATLIGDQMGKTAGQIRADITSGALGAEQALDALVAGMAEKYAGAAANVKETWDGATDRVSAAVRDIASLLATPLVDPQGGGAAIGWANGLADALRDVETVLVEMPSGVRVAGSALVGITGLAATGAGAFLLMGTRVMENVDALRALWRGSGRASVAVRGIGIAAGAATAALAVAAIGLTVWANNVAEARARTEEYKGTLDEFGNRTQATIQQINEALAADTNDWLSNLFGKDPRSLIDWAEKYGLAIEDLQGYILGLEESQLRVNAAIAEYEGQFSAGREQRRAREETDLFRGALDKQAGALTNAEKQAAQKALADEKAGISAEEAAFKTEEAARAAEEAAQAYQEWHRTVENAASSFVDVVDAYDQVIEANIELARATAEATGDSAASWEDFYDGSTVTAKEWIGSLQEQVAEQREWADNLVAAATKVREELPPELQEAGQALVDELAAKGPEGAEALATFVDMKPKQRQKIVAASKEAADLAGDELQKRLKIARDPVMGLDVNTANAELAVDSFITEQSGRRIYLDIHGRQIGGRSNPETPIFRSSGGPVSGPGSETSDSILARLSHNEHVVSASEVRGFGGHGALERLRALARAGALRSAIPGFARGGAVAAAKREVGRAREKVKEAREEAKARRAASREAQRAYSRADGDAARRAAKRDADRARKAERAADNALRDAQRALKEAQARQSRVRDERRDLRTDIRRGSLVEQITGSRSGALSAVDRARDLARSGDLTQKQSKALDKAAKQAEKALEKHYKALDKINGKIEQQRDLVQQVGAMQERVASQIMGEVGLGQLGRTEDEYGRTSGVTSGSVRAHVAKKLAQVRTFNSKLDALRQRGAPNMLLQEVLGAGLEGGTELANALLSASASEWTAITRDWVALEDAARRTGDIATLSEFGTTTEAAQALLEEYEKAAAKLEKQIEKQANKIIEALEKALSGGVKKAGGGWVYGPGTRTSDSVHLQASRDEFVVNAASAIANGPLLEAINASRGPVSAVRGGSVVQPVLSLSGLSLEVNLTTDKRFAAAIWRQGGQEVARTDRAVVRGIVGAS